MGSSAQKSSGVHWCSRWVRFNEVPEKVPKVPEKVWEALVQSQVRFNRVLEKVPEKVPRSQQGSGEGSREGLGGFGAEPRQVHRVPCGRLWCRARLGSTGFRRRFRRRSGRLWGTLRCFQRLASEHASEIFVKIRYRGC